MLANITKYCQFNEICHIVKVKKYLRKLGKCVIIARKKVQEHVKGTILHLEVIWVFLRIFMGEELC